MKNNDIEKNLKKLADQTVPQDIRRLAEEKSEQFISKLTKSKQTILWRNIMNRKITKLAAAAVILLATLTLAYGATQVIKYFEIFGMRVRVNSDKINTEEDAKKAVEEFRKLYREGKAKETEPGLWVATLSNGVEFAYGGNNPELAGLSPEQKDSLLKAQSDEIQKLREAGKYERTFIKEVVENGVKIRLYKDQFTLSCGKIVTMTFGEEQVSDKSQKN